MGDAAGGDMAELGSALPLFVATASTLTTAAAATKLSANQVRFGLAV